MNPDPQTLTQGNYAFEGGGKVVSTPDSLAFAASVVAAHAAAMVSPNPETRNLKTDTRNPRPQTPNPRPDTQKLIPEIRNPNPETLDPTPETRNPKPETRYPKPGTRKLIPETRNPKPENWYPKPKTRVRNQVPRADGHAMAIEMGGCPPKPNP